MTPTTTRSLRYLAAGISLLALGAFAQSPIVGSAFHLIPSAHAAGQGKGGGSGGGSGGGNGQGAGGQGQHGAGMGAGTSGGQSGVEGKIVHGSGEAGTNEESDSDRPAWAGTGKRGSSTPGGGEESDSDRPAWAGMKGGKAGGGGKPAEAGSKKGDLYGDLWVVLRDANGVPILDEYGHVQPLDAEGNLIPLNEDGEPLDPTKVVEVEFSRLSVARSPAKILDKAYDEAIATLNSATSITLDSAGRLVVTVDGTTSTIDAPLENLALYATLLSEGYLPGLTASDSVLGSLTYLKDPSFTTADYERAAALFGAASDKTTTILKDTIAYMDSILDVAGTITGPDGGTYVDFSTYSYDRSATYPGTVEILVSNGDGTYTTKEVPLIEAVFNNEDYTGTGIDAFSQAADDARAVIEFVHDNPVPATN